MALVAVFIFPRVLDAWFGRLPGSSVPPLKCSRSCPLEAQVPCTLNLHVLESPGSLCFLGSSRYVKPRFEGGISLPWGDISRLFRTPPWSTSGLYAWSFSRPFPSGKEVSWTDMLNYSVDFSCLIHLLAPQSNRPSHPSWFFKFKISLWPTPWGPGTCWKWSHLSLT